MIVSTRSGATPNSSTASFDVAAAEQVEEGVDAPVGRGRLQPVGQVVAVVDGNHAVRGQPLVVRRTGDAEHRCAGTLGELDGDRAHAAGGAGYGDDVPGHRLTERTAA